MTENMLDCFFWHKHKKGAVAPNQANLKLLQFMMMREEKLTSLMKLKK